MAEVTITIGDRQHVVGCHAGEEAQVERLARMLDERWDTAVKVSGALTHERTMMFVALMLADALDEAQHQPGPGGDVGPATLDRIADRLERVASALEQAEPRS